MEVSLIAVIVIISIVYSLVVGGKTRKESELEELMGERERITITAFERRLQLRELIVVDLFGSTAEGVPVVFEGFGVTNDYIDQLAGHEISGELVGQKIVGFDASWDLEPMAAEIADGLDETDHGGTADSVHGRYRGYEVDVHLFDDLLSVELLYREPSRGEPDFLIELERVVSPDQKALYGDEILHGDHLVRLLEEGAEEFYTSTVAPHLDAWSELLVDHGWQVTFEPGRVGYALPAVPSLAAAHYALEELIERIPLLGETDTDAGDEVEPAEVDPSGIW